MIRFANTVGLLLCREVIEKRRVMGLEGRSAEDGVKDDGFTEVVGREFAGFDGDRVGERWFLPVFGGGALAFFAAEW